VSDEPPRSRKPQLDPNEPVVSVPGPDGTTIELTYNEYRLVLIGLVDFGGDWAALEAATAFVLDGEAKQGLIRQRLRALAPYLDVLLRSGLDGVELFTARHWFRAGEL
jgi:hypothetical protein